MMLAVASVALTADLAGRTTESLDWVCRLAAGWDPDAGDQAEVTNPTTRDDPAFYACLDRYSPAPAWWLPLLGPVILIGAAAMLFFLITTRKRRRVVPLSKVDPDVQEVLDDLVAVAGLERAPEFVVDPTATSTRGAAVFGRDRKPVVRLDVGLLVHRGKDPDGFRAVVLHELAHIHNRDITLTYVTVALWRTFLALALLPDSVLLAKELFDGPSSPLSSFHVPDLARGIVLAILMVLLVHLARADVLRTREVHADLTALRWGADRRGWDEADRPSFGAVFAELWRTHPRWDLRRASLDDPAPLFGVRALPMFLTGAAAELINNAAFLYLDQQRNLGEWPRQFVALVTAGLVTGVAGIALWRAIVHARLTETNGPSGVLSGVWLGLGMVTAELLAGPHVLYDWVPARWWAMTVPVAAGVAFTWWIAQCARLWAGTWRGRTLRAPMLLVLVSGGLVLSTWFQWWLTGGGIVLLFGSPLSTNDMVTDFQSSVPGAGPEWLLRITMSTLLLMASLIGAPLILVAVALAWAVPLLAWTVRPGPLRWVHEAVTDFPEPASQRLPTLRRVVLPGLVTGALAAGALLLVGRDLEELAYIATTFAAAVAAALLASLTAPGTHRLPTTLAGAQIAAMITIAAGALLRSWFVLKPMITAGLVAAALLAVAIAAVRALVRRLSRLRPVVPSPRPARIRSRRVAVAMFTAAALAFAGAEIAYAVTSDIPKSIPKVTVTSMPSVATTRMQLSAWNYVGGRTVLDRVATATTCEVVTAAAQEAEAFLRVPDQRLQPLWQAVITRTDHARAKCAANSEAGLAGARQAADAAAALRIGVDVAARGGTPDATVPEPTQLELAQWADWGARDLLFRYATTAKNVYDYLKRAQGEVETTTLAGYCTDLTRVATDGQDFFRVNDPWMQDRWKRFMEEAGKTGAHCKRALMDLDLEALRTALAEITVQQRTALCLEAWLRGSSKNC
ncbi:M48 family metalloprotease [Lentzea terrae]|uniref:M48 family metalloprotease n=1 Tax=Lentzea terrae TaxID=2200761 RepID=UPI001E622B90|nr:M48 family metalloprotease [Lentzea terrae]